MPTAIQRLEKQYGPINATIPKNLPDTIDLTPAIDNDKSAIPNFDDRSDIPDALVQYKKESSFDYMPLGLVGLLLVLGTRLGKYGNPSGQTGNGVRRT